MMTNKPKVGIKLSLARIFRSSVTKKIYALTLTARAQHLK